ncbi:MAG: primase-helicase family protein [Verrucomicrobiae bacterium]
MKKESHTFTVEPEQMPEIYYAGRQGYAIAHNGGFIPLPNESQVAQHLLNTGLPKENIAPTLCMLRLENFVSYIGPVAGFKSGLHSSNGDNILVTTGPTIVEAGAGDPTFIKNVIADLLPDQTQHASFMKWLLHCRRAVVKGRRVQTPALALTGSKGDGKSLVIEIVRQTLGNRSANAYRFLSGETNFNKDILGAELLVMDDPAASKDPRSRFRLAQNIKGTHFTASIHVEGKNKDGFDVSPVQALIIAVNSDPEHLRVLPELDDSMEDKIMLLKSSPVGLPDALAGREEEIKREIAAALPAFLTDLESLDMSEAYDGRGRLKCYWNPGILEAIGLLSPEQQVLELIHQVGAIRMDISSQGRWAGTAATLEGLLTDKDAHVSHAAKRLLSWGGACGTFLGRLADRVGTGVARGKKDPRTKIQTYIIEGNVEQQDEDGKTPW